MSFDFDIRLGDILTMIGLFGGGIIVVTYMRADLRILGLRVASVEQRLGTITEILVEQARHDQRLAANTRRIESLERELQKLRIP